jgi:hypothetical protein
MNFGIRDFTRFIKAREMVLVPMISTGHAMVTVTRFNNEQSED